MAHTHHDHDHATTVVERDSSAGVVVAVIVALLTVLLIWLFFSSGWVGGGRSEAPREQTRIEERNDRRDVNIQVPPAGTPGGGQTPQSPAPTST